MTVPRKLLNYPSAGAGQVRGEEDHVTGINGKDDHEKQTEKQALFSCSGKK